MTSDARSGPAEHAEEAVRNYADRLGIQWLGEVRWFYAKSLNFAFWGLTAIWYLFVIHHNSSGFVMVLTSFAAAMFVMTINAGAAMIEAFDRQQDIADSALKLCQQLEQELAWAQLDNDKLKPLWGSGEEAEGGGKNAPSADVLPWPDEDPSGDMEHASK